jgi:rhodanese-related sulfurtransferase
MASPPVVRMPPPRDTSVSQPVTVESEPAGQVLRAARAAAAQGGLDYAGNLSALQASAIVKAQAGRLVDVRADVELDLEGYVPGSTHVPWLIAPDFDVNPAFVPELEGKARKDEILIFHCRRGSRSAAAAAAATRAGFRNAFSVNGGVDELLALCADKALPSGSHIAPRRPEPES